MKKLISLTALLLSLFLLTSCTAQQILGDVAQQLQDANSQPGDDAPGIDASAPDAGYQVEEAADMGPGAVADDPVGELRAEAGMEEDISSAGAASAPDAEAPDPTPRDDLPAEEPAPDFTGLTADQCVTDADGAAGQLPRVVPDCPGAASINQDIEGSFRYLVDADYCTLRYETFKNGDVLSILITQLYDGDVSYFTPYNLNLATGQRMSGEDLMAYLGIERTIVGDNEIAAMAEQFELQYGGADSGDSAAFYQEQYDRTTANDNAEFGRLWLGSGGTLYFVAKLYSIAGAEFYEYPMSTGLIF